MNDEEHQKLLEYIAKLEEALKFYADEQQWSHTLDDVFRNRRIVNKIKLANGDRGDVARKALEER